MSGEGRRPEHSAAPDYLASWYAGDQMPRTGAPDPYGQDAVSPYQLPAWAHQGGGRSEPPPPTLPPEAMGAGASAPRSPRRSEDAVKWLVVGVVTVVAVIGIVLAVVLDGGGGPGPAPEPTTAAPTTPEPTSEEPTTEEPTTDEATDDPGEPQAYGDDPELDALWDACEGGDGQACDELFSVAPVDSEYEEFGWTCGGRVSGGSGGSCAVEMGDAPNTYGDDAALDDLWDACEGGDGQACDDLFYESPYDSEYEDFGWTCGERHPGGERGGECAVALGDAADRYGEDPELDALWDACEAGDPAACDDLYLDSPSGSEYEDFGFTCGGRVPEGSGELCTDVM
ncbi:hypothetical protein [Georgenia alba]|uniref:Uncharacterized protein n=1 Tax=Georgenia alba TaxID=2233858 RepID=A0ABW2Q218_9MICO